MGFDLEHSEVGRRIPPDHASFEFAFVGQAETVIQGLA